MATSASASVAPAALVGHGIFAVVVFAVVSLLSIRPLTLRLHLRLRLLTAQQQQQQTAAGPTLTVRIDHVAAPLLGVLLLLATRTIGAEQVRLGISGEGHIEPYDVLALFLSLAYIAISLDATGLLRSLALLVCIRGGGRGLRLYLLLYAFFWTLGVAVGNDPVILSGTAFLVYFTRVAGITPPSAWIWAQFVAANVSSAVLVSSNPTNLVIAKGFGIGFGTYTAYMLLPSAASALATVSVLLLFFRNRPPPRASQRPRRSNGVGTDAVAAHAAKSSSASHPAHHGTTLSKRAAHQTNIPEGASSIGDRDADSETRHADASDLQPTIFIPRTIVPPDVSPRAALVDPWGALFTSAVMLATLILLVATSVVGGVKVFMVALPGAVLCLLRDTAYDSLRWRKARKERERQRCKSRPSASARTKAVHGKNEEIQREREREREKEHEHEHEREQKEEAPEVQGEQMDENSPRKATIEAESDAIELQTVLPARITEEAASRIDTPSSSVPPPISSMAALEPSESRKSILTNGSASIAGSFQQTLQPQQQQQQRRRRRLFTTRIAAVPARLASVFPTVAVVLSRLPLPLLPFAFSMFILVQGLAHVGFIDIVARGLGRVCAHGGAAGTAFFISTLGVVLCNIAGTNIGATILLTKALQSDQFSAQLAAHASTDSAELITKAAIYSVAFGSNVGALGGSFAASLAGLLWRQGLRQGGVIVGARQFALWCAVSIVPATAVGVAVLLAEVQYFHIGGTEAQA
ncbi:hypothetical protein K437DRAFT_255071 [Tilletiaria anomala UBC 951]|uniref:Citrate transporter-like domain-containing protein n=1 Tax=Tilletiaria anomala (strain ATCC 24038 / CBS 436.72 / UBC 951) TaxID=1037660 RepID=A0A066W8V5_TILAU|nr:uncharacterized protein K437DRAFT_255071 [Tilletiaria anomala UBC 951]KDN50367.1 hypothetical protein K437DRAFT_255071 [Tilletiaria anomala UBC 951]